jgi:hypothetical protein
LSFHIIGEVGTGYMNYSHSCNCFFFLAELIAIWGYPLFELIE